MRLHFEEGGGVVAVVEVAAGSAEDGAEVGGVGDVEHHHVTAVESLSMSTLPVMVRATANCVLTTMSMNAQNFHIVIFFIVLLIIVIVEYVWKPAVWLWLSLTMPQR